MSTPALQPYRGPRWVHAVRFVYESHAVVECSDGRGAYVLPGALSASDWGVLTPGTFVEYEVNPVTMDETLGPRPLARNVVVLSAAVSAELQRLTAAIDGITNILRTTP